MQNSWRKIRLPMIRISNVSKSFESVHAVNDVSFNVAVGEVVGLLGPNGAGKTTTMRMITGYITPDSGLITVAGMDVGVNSIDARRHIGYLPENAPLYSDMEVVEYLQYITRLRGIAIGGPTMDMKEIVKLCGLKPVVGRPIDQLSKGFRQRVGLATAIIHKPDVLILDEPTTGLDPNQIVEIRNLIKEIGRERTVILSTHIMQEVEATCSRAIIINEGQVVEEGSIDELLHRGAGRTRYTVALSSDRDGLERALDDLDGFKIEKWLSNDKSSRQRFVLSDDISSKSVDAEDIFKWAVRHNFVLSELTGKSASLEDIFRKLTNQND